MNYYFVTVGDNTGDNWTNRYLITCKGKERAACNRAVKMALEECPYYDANDLVVLYVQKTCQQ